MKPPALAILVLSLLGAAAGQSEDLGVSPPAKNWTLPLFTKEGYRSMTLRGSEVWPVTVDRIEVKDLAITTFTGGAAAKPETILLSPTATFYVNERLAAGPDLVRVIRDDIDVTGTDWSYDHTKRKIIIARNARVVFRAPLPDILK
jgi:hypothetical protein